jgi:hypothetical protein
MFEFEVEAVGLTESWAARNGIEVITGKMGGYTRAPYYLGALPIEVKLTVEKENRWIASFGRSRTILGFFSWGASESGFFGMQCSLRLNRACRHPSVHT